MTSRIDKLCAVKEREVVAAEGALARARAATTAAEHALVAIERAWQEAVATVESAAIMADLDVIDARARTLRQAVQRADAALNAKRAEEARFGAAVSAARMELRRFEMWGERTEATLAATRARVTRAAEDALAARARGEGRGIP